jgi:hypothetical protein
MTATTETDEINKENRHRYLSTPTNFLKGDVSELRAERGYLATGAQISQDMNALSDPAYRRKSNIHKATAAAFVGGKRLCYRILQRYEKL